jgi:hypothetical protein
MLGATSLEALYFCHKTRSAFVRAGGAIVQDVSFRLRQPFG